MRGGILAGEVAQGAAVTDDDNGGSHGSGDESTDPAPAAFPSIPKRWNAGFRQRRLPGPLGRAMPTAFWYPTLSPESRKRVGIYELSAAFDAEPADGRFGLIAISHGSGGGSLNHHDWAEAFARAGYVVVAPTHVGDQSAFRRGGGTREQMLERPEQLRHAAQAALDDPELGPIIDAARIGVMGFSAGGYTALIAAGGRPDFSLVPGHAPDIVQLGPDDWRSVAIPGVAAGIFLAPFSLPFNAKGLENVHAICMIVRADADTITPNAEHAERLAASLARGARMETVSGGHYVFIAPAVESMAKRYPQYYADTDGVDRVAIHIDLTKIFISFFDQAVPLASDKENRGRCKGTGRTTFSGIFGE